MADIITVAALNKYVRSSLESDPVLLDIAIQGEISNFNCHYKTGHCYFSLKDDKASVSAVMFRSDAQALSFQPENGMGVIVRGRVSLFERDGRFQLYVQHMFPDGAGALQMAFDQLKKRLAAEGLFAPEAKKPLPAHPARVGLVTSKTGAALQDILNVAARRCPGARLLLAPVTVQGEAAAPGICEAIQRLDREGCDVIIVARGGGSAEDLWVFNAEQIARTVFACKTPVVSAIGHEIDFTILDFVADVRAPTPSAAAEIVLPNLSETLRSMLDLYAMVAENIHSRIDSCYNEISRTLRHPALRQTAALPATLRQQTDALATNIGRAAAAKIAATQKELGAAAALAASLNPYGVLARGYAIAEMDGKALRSVQDAQTGSEICLHMQDGRLSCEVTSIQPGEIQHG